MTEAHKKKEKKRKNLSQNEHSSREENNPFRQRDGGGLYVVLPGGCAFHKFSQNVTSFHKFSQHENCYKIVKAGEKW